MTAEEAIELLYDIQTDAVYNVLSDEKEALEMAINVLKQQPVIDKIEEEIKSPNRGTCDYFIVDRIEEIINKYKAENEV